MAELCTDNRFELIEKYKAKLIEATNIETAPDEMSVLDDLLFMMGKLFFVNAVNAKSCMLEILCIISTTVQTAAQI